MGDWRTSFLLGPIFLPCWPSLIVEEVNSLIEVPSSLLGL
jgi:hypothetical protein